MYINSSNNLSLYNQNFTGLKSHRKFFTNESFDKIVITSKMTKSQKRKAIRDNNILEMFALGFSREKIAEALDISFSTVKRLLEKYQVIKIATANRDEIIKKRLMNGEKREQIAKDLGISIRPVCQVAEKNNIFRIKKQERDEKIINLYSKGFQLKDIANQFNISEATVLRVIKQHNKDYNSKLY